MSVRILASPMQQDISLSDRALQEVWDMHYSVFTAKWLACLNSKENRQMKRFLSAVALACVLSVSVLAGEVHSTGAPEPAPGSQSSSVVATVILTILSIVR